MPLDNDTDISLKQLILNIKEYLSYFMLRWKSIASVSVIVALLFLLYNLGQEKRYSASLSFMLNVDERGLSSGVSSLLGQLGFGIPGTETNFDKIMELSRARAISQSAFFDTIKINNNKDLLANLLIDELEKIDKWSHTGLLSFSDDTLSLDGFRFSHDSVPSFTVLENKALKHLHTILVGDKKNKPLFISNYDELTGIMYLTMSSSNEALSISIVITMYEKLSKYYIDKSTEKQKYEHDIIQEKYDSINYALGNVQYRLAAFEDSNLDIYRKIDILQKNKLKVEEQKLLIMSGKAEEQLQIAKITLENKTPYIQVIDLPIGPIKPDNPSLIYYFVIGLITGITLSLIWLGGGKMYRDILSPEN